MHHRTPSLLLSILLLTHTAPAFAAFVEDITLDPAERAEQLFFDPAIEGALPSTTVTRSALVRMIVERLYLPEEIEGCFSDISAMAIPSFTLLYSDVHVDHPDAEYLCIALRDGIARGYGDGSFHPDRPVNFAESAKIISRSFILAPYGELASGPWFQPYVSALTMRNAVPVSIVRFDQAMTGVQLNEIITRIVGGITWEKSQTYPVLEQMSARKL